MLLHRTLYIYEREDKAMKAKNIVISAAAAVFSLSGCAQDISHTLASESSAVEALATIETTTTSDETTTTAAEITTTTTTTIAETEPVTEETEASEADTTVSVDETAAADAGEGDSTAGEYSIYSDEYKSYPLSAEYKDFLSECVFVGDSICSGLKAYELLPANQVLAVGNVAARNIFEDWVEFKVNGEKMTLLSALVDLKPKYIVFSMGMNDVNMTSEQAFCKNYEDILSQVESFLPDAKLYVCSITPITYGESGKLFTYPENIDSFNAALKEYLDSTEKWVYVDVQHELKNTRNMLKDDYLGSPDGVHLAPGAYYAIMYQICERAVDGKIYNLEDGTFTVEGEEAGEVAVVTETPAETAASSDEFVRTAETEYEGALAGTLALSDEDF